MVSVLGWQRFLAKYSTPQDYAVLEGTFWNLSPVVWLDYLHTDRPKKLVPIIYKQSWKLRMRQIIIMISASCDHI